MNKMVLIDENDQFLLKENSTIKFRLIIPTLNRPKELIYNFNKILFDINRINPKFNIQIIISENCSDLENRIDFLTLKNSFNKINNLNNMSVVFIKRGTRFSLGRHMHWLGNLPGAEWVMWLGDDDLLSPTYLSFVFDAIEKNNCVTAINADYGVITAKNFFEICDQKEEIEEKISIDKYNSKKIDSFIVHRGHQLSGLVYKKEIIEYSNKFIPEENLYPWMGYQITSLKKGEIHILQGLHARITSDTPKLFSYGKDGLFPDICESIMAGFHDDYKMGVYYAIKVLGGIGSWRIFMTSKNSLLVFVRFLALIADKRMDKLAFCGLTPIIFYRVVRNQAGKIKRAIIGSNA